MEQRQAKEEPVLERRAQATGPVADQLVQKAETEQAREPELDLPARNRQDKATRTLARPQGVLWAHAGALASLQQAVVLDIFVEP